MYFTLKHSYYCHIRVFLYVYVLASGQHQNAIVIDQVCDVDKIKVSYIYSIGVGAIFRSGDSNVGDVYLATSKEHEMVVLDIDG